jgi:hypothetical protein
MLASPAPAATGTCCSLLQDEELHYYQSYLFPFGFQHPEDIHAYFAKLSSGEKNDLVHHEKWKDKKRLVH